MNFTRISSEQIELNAFLTFGYSHLPEYVSLRNAFAKILFIIYLTKYFFKKYAHLKRNRAKIGEKEESVTPSSSLH
jgi:hypothetical protein